MTNTFTYSILQYKHSLLLGEAINLGVLFSFPHYEHLQFVSGNTNRVKSVYPEFNKGLISNIFNSIEKKTKDEGKSLFKCINSNGNLKDYIHRNFLQEDASALQFTEPISVADTFDNYKNTINTFSQLLLPGLIIRKPNLIRHNEDFDQ